MGDPARDEALNSAVVVEDGDPDVPGARERAGDRRSLPFADFEKKTPSRRKPGGRFVYQAERAGR